MRLENWWATTLPDLRPEPTLDGDATTDVLVIGGGAAGLAAARRLREAGRDVTLLEKTLCGGSTTGRSSGFLTPASELELAQLVRRFGPEDARRIWEVPLRGIAMIVGEARAHGIDCDLMPLDSVFLAREGAGDSARDEHEARRRLGYASTLLVNDGLRATLGSDAFEAAVRYDGTFGINAYRYAQDLKRVLVGRGVHVHEATEVTSLEGSSATTSRGRVRANEVLVCIDEPRRLTRTGERGFGVQTFLSVTDPLDPSDLANLFPGGPVMCWDSRLVYSYFRPTGDGRLLLGGGTLPTTYVPHGTRGAHPIEVAQRRFREDVPALRHVEFTRYWPGRIQTTRDLLPTVILAPRGRGPHHIVGAPGLPWATFCGDLAARAIAGDDLGDDAAYLEDFSPKRPFAVPLGLRRALGRPMTFALSHAWAKYRQRDA